MSSLFRAAFLIGVVYYSSVQAFSSTSIVLAQFLAGEQGASVRAQLNKLNPRNVPASTILLALSRQKEARNVARESSMRKTLAVFSVLFGGLKWCSGMLFSGIVLMKDGLGALASFFGKDAQLGAFAVATAGGFVYVMHQINQVQESVGQVQVTQADHTNRLGNLQSASSAIISTQVTHGEQLTRVEGAVGELNVGQTRLEDSVSAAQSLLVQLNMTVGENAQTLQVVRASVQDLVTRLGNLEQGVDMVNERFTKFQTSFNESNEALNQRFIGFETTVSGLSSRVDDGFGKVEQLQLLVAECIEKTSKLFGENSEQVRSLRDEFVRLAGKLDASLIGLREEIKQNNAGTHEKLDQLLAASSSQSQAVKSTSLVEHLRSGSLLSQNNRNPYVSPILSVFPSVFEHGQPTGRGDQLSLTYRTD